MIKVFIDIETIAAQSDSAIELLKANIEDKKAKLSPPGNYGSEAAEKWLVKKRAELNDGLSEAHLKTSLNGDLGEIITICWSVGGDDIQTVNRESGDDEYLLLVNFIDKLTELITLKGGSLDKIQWIGHNLIRFDLPFIYKRCVINGLKPKFDIPNNAKHGYNAYDTSTGWAGYNGYISQVNLCKTIGLPTNKDDMDGSMVYQAWLDGKYDEIAKYCKSDVETVIAMYNRLNFL